MWATSYIRKSGQGWKLAIAGAFLFSGGGLVMFMASGYGDQLAPDVFIPLLLIGLLTSLGGGLAWPARSIRCRACGFKLLWHAISAMPHAGSIEWFLIVDHCPRCGATE